MPQRVTCTGCKAVLYDSMELKPPSEIIQSLGGACPTCGKKLDDAAVTFLERTNIQKK